MRTLEAEQLQTINGGGWKSKVFLGLAGIGIFIVGVIDGYFRPLACR